jgi:hypothetical protein
MPQLGGSRFTNRSLATYDCNPTESGHDAIGQFSIAQPSAGRESPGPHHP